MYPNLEAEMARKKLTNIEISKACDMTEKSFSNKRTGKTDFTLKEIKIIKQTFFPSCTLEYLFSDTAIVSS